MKLNGTNTTHSRIEQIDVRSARKPELVEAVQEYQKQAQELSEDDRRTVKIAVVTAVTTVLLSMVFNASALTAGKATGSLWWFVGLCVGILIPLWILALTYAGQHVSEKNKRLAWACYALTIVALIVSLPHLCHGYAALGLSFWFEAVPLALVTDCLQILMKLVILSLVKK